MESTIIGMYGDALVIRAFPVILPGLRTVVHSRLPVGFPYDSLTLRALMDAEQIAELPLWDLPSERNDANLRLVAMMMFSPLPVTAPGTLSITLQCGDDAPQMTGKITICCAETMAQRRWVRRIG